jgi:predicted amidohydrolase YtcJ
MESNTPLTLAIIHAKLWTGKPDPSLNANAIGVIGDTIVSVSDTQSVLNLCNSDTVVIDAQMGMLLPGFTDCHCHFLDAGLRLLSVKLRDAKSREQFTDRVARIASDLPPGTWITGGDWDHQQWGGTLPEKSWIDAVTPNHPVWLNRMDGHMSLANTFALKLAGVNRQTSEVPGGEIVRESDGTTPTGILKDSAQNLVTAVLPKRSAEQNRRALKAAMSYVAARGITQIHNMVTVDCACGLWPKNMGADAEHQDMEASYEELEVYRSAQRDGELITRIRTAVPLASWKRLLKELELHGKGDDWFRVSGLKATLDGSLGSHTAAMLHDYDDTPGYRGNIIWDPAIIERHIQEASEAGLQVYIHAIGDRAVREQLNIFERISARLAGRDLRFRIEHAQHIAPEDIARFGKLGVIASMQMTHLADDGRWATSAIGMERMRTSWPMKSLVETGAVVALGSDWFVTQPAPLDGIYAAVTRRTIDGKHPSGLIPEERVRVEDALHGYTTSAAYSVFEEGRRGTLEPGKLADCVLLDRDLRSISADEIPQTNVLLTVTGGKIVYQK